MGVVTLALTIIDQLSQTGFHTALVQREKDVEAYLDVAFTWHVLRGAVIAGLLVLGSPLLARFYHEPVLAPVMLAVAMQPLVTGFLNVGQIHFHRRLDFRALSLVKLGTVALRLAVFVPAILHFRNVWALVLGVLASAVSGVIVSYVSHPYRPKFRWDRSRLAELIRFGKWITGFAAMTFCITYGDNLFISKYLGLAALGVYQIAYEVSNLPATNITHVLGRIGFPMYARLQSDRAALRGAFLRVMRATLLLAGPVSVLLFLGAGDLVNHVLGEKWARAIPLIRILSIAGLIRAFAALAGPLFHAVGRTDLDFKMNLPRFLCTIIGLWPAAHFFGLEGVCVVVLVAIVTTLPTWFVALPRLLDLRVREIARENVLALLVSLLLGLSFGFVRPLFGLEPMGALLGVLASLLGWLAALRVLGWITPYDFFAELGRVRASLRSN
jgi:O-antigen/teichoic acid export membrane protein